MSILGQAAKPVLSAHVVAQALSRDMTRLALVHTTIATRVTTELSVLLYWPAVVVCVVNSKEKKKRKKKKDITKKIAE